MYSSNAFMDSRPITTGTNQHTLLRLVVNINF